MSRNLRQMEADLAVAAPDFGHFVGRDRRARVRGFLAAKRAWDVFVALMAVPVVVLAAIALLAINPIWNRGPLIYAQKRMGRRCRPFRAYKFRTMRAAPDIGRGPNDPLETERITRLGRWLRRSHIDEFPQFVNVLLGEMSVVGPRPDYWDHAIHYVDVVPGYRERHTVRPGITGLAQVDGGYAEGIEATIIKTRLDLRYIDTLGYGTDAYVLRRTIAVVLSGIRAR